ncbi:MAG: zinc ribbon domain-containing protein [Sedimentisphaerales bacterium]|nr:zinc ribbon domain-containing protein [Sedimentisphaerales bacterium]
MNCPKCNHENPVDSIVCELCSCELTNIKEIEPEKEKIKTLRFLSIVSACMFPVFILFIKYSVLAFLMAFFSFCLTVATIPQLIRISRKRKIKRSAIVLTIIILTISSVQMLLFSFLRTDAPPISNDYTINDIKSTSPEYNQSYELLLSLGNDDGITDSNVIGLSKEDVNNLEVIYEIFKEKDLRIISEKIKEKEEEILTLWDKAEKGRNILIELNSFPEIADLSEPILDANYPELKNLKYLIFLYRSYITLQSITDNHEQAFNELAMLNSIFKKLSLNCRNITTKIVCIAYFAQIINSSNFIISNPETPNEILLKLKDIVYSLSDKNTSFRNNLIFDYLTMKNELGKIRNEPKLKHPNFAPLKYNSSLRLFRNYFDELIAYEENQKIGKQLRIWPAFYPNIPVHIDKDGKLNSLYYKIYNPVGYLLIEIFVPACEKVISIKKRFEIHSDMLKVILNLRLDKKADIKVLDYGDEYSIDVENKFISYTFNAHKVNMPHEFSDSVSEDIEIKLPINPEVLGLTESQAK